MSDSSSRPLVSILTPCFRSAAFLEACIQSVIDQDYPDVEHIIQDGGSDDGTLEILKRYDEHIEWVSEPDQGQNDALDKALKRCRGDIILVLNADDMLLPHAARWGVENLARFPDDGVIYGDEYIIDEQENVLEFYHGPDNYSYDKLLCVELVPPAQAAFIRREVMEKVGMGTDPTIKTCPDYEMWVRIGRHFSMRHVPGFVSKYRRHEGSGTHQSDLIPQLVSDKRLVMDRVLDDPASPEELKNLRNRAYFSLEMWGLCSLLDAQNDGRPALLRRATASLLANFSRENLRAYLRFFNTWLAYILRR